MELVEHARAIFMGLPEITERLSHGTPTWFVRDKKSIAALWPDGHHDNDFPHLWLAAPLGAQEALIASDPGRYFRPPYVGHRGWIGMRVEQDMDWSEVAEMADQAFRSIAAKSLVARLDARSGQ